MRPSVQRAVPPEGCAGDVPCLSPRSGGLQEIFGIPWLVEASPDLCLQLHTVFSLCAGLPPNVPYL